MLFLSLLPLTPRTVSRLSLPTYSSEHVLLFGRADGADDQRLLPVLLRYSQGVRLEDFAREGVLRNSVPLGMECIARKSLFEAVSGTAMAPWDLVGVDTGCSNLPEAVIRYANARGWAAQFVLLSLEAELYTGKSGVARYREEYAAGPNAARPVGPPPLRLGELAAVLRCTPTSGGDDLTIELDDPGEAAMYGRVVQLPLLIAEETWEARAVASEGLPQEQRRTPFLG